MPATKEAPITDAIRHRKDCPKRRMESFKQTQPVSEGGSAVVITRCVDCGEYVVDGVPADDKE